MPKSSPQKLKYQKARNSRPEEVNKREANNRARYQMLKAGKVHVGDKLDVAHKVALEDGGSNDPKNLKVESQNKNRGWRRVGNKGAKDTYNVKLDK